MLITIRKPQISRQWYKWPIVGCVSCRLWGLMPLLNIKIIFKWVCYIHSYEYGKCVATTFEQVTIAIIKMTN